MHRLWLFGAAAVMLLLERRRRTMTTTSTPTRPPSPPVPRQRRRSTAWDFAVGLPVILLIIGSMVLFLRGGDGPVADEPVVPDAETAVVPQIEYLTWSCHGGWGRPSDRPHRTGSSLVPPE